MTLTGGPASLLLVMLAILLRAAVPGGWMPSTDGALTITLCTAQGMVEARLLADGSLDQAPDDGVAADQPCAFAAFAAVAIVPALIAGAAPFATRLADVAPSRPGVSVGRGLAAPPPPPTGPPTIL